MSQTRARERSETRLKDAGKYLIIKENTVSLPSPRLLELHVSVRLGIVSPWAGVPPGRWQAQKQRVSPYSTELGRAPSPRQLSSLRPRFNYTRKIMGIMAQPPRSAEKMPSIGLQTLPPPKPLQRKLGKTPKATPAALSGGQPPLIRVGEAPPQPGGAAGDTCHGASEGTSGPLDGQRAWARARARHKGAPRGQACEVGVHAAIGKNLRNVLSTRTGMTLKLMKMRAASRAKLTSIPIPLLMDLDSGRSVVSRPSHSFWRRQAPMERRAVGWCLERWRVLFLFEAHGR